MSSQSEIPNDDGEGKIIASEQLNNNGHAQHDLEKKDSRSKFKDVYTWACTVLLLLNYFLAQYDKFILSYFQTPLSESLSL